MDFIFHLMIKVQTPRFSFILFIGVKPNTKENLHTATILLLSRIKLLH
jgi:hypothetical protein